MRRTLLAAVVVSMLGVAPARAATITVNTPDDVRAGDAVCSLREAIDAANGDAAAGGCPAGLDADVIVLPAGTFAIAPPNNGDGHENANAGGDFDILQPLTILGAGAGVTAIVGADGERVLDNFSVGPVELARVTITGGHATALGGLDGGGIRSAAGNLTVRDCVIRGNRAGDGGSGGSAQGGDGGFGSPGSFDSGGAGGVGGIGGGIYAEGALSVTGCTITDNHAGDGGAGGAGTGGSGGLGNPHAGAGGNGTGGSGGSGGTGGGIALVAPGVRALTISLSTISFNTAGDGGPGGAGSGGGGGSGSTNGNGGFAGIGTGGVGGFGGSGGGVYTTEPATVTGSLFTGNRTGNGGAGGTGLGGNGGPGAGSDGDGGDGGSSTGGVGAAAGGGGAMRVVDVGLSLTNTTVHANVTGGGGLGGSAGSVSRGRGGNGFGANGLGGDGGHASGGPGGTGGLAAALETGFDPAAPPRPITLSHATISSGVGGGGGTGGAASGGVPGVGGQANGAVGSTLPGPTGAVGLNGLATWSGYPMTLTNVIHVSSSCSGPAGSFSDSSASIAFNTVGCPGEASDPKLAALEDNGGPTQSRLPQPGSAALNSASGACPPVDQRGVTRPQLGGCDVGAIEAAAPGAETGEATAVTDSGATLRGTATPNGPAVSYFEHGPTAGYGARTAEADAGRSVAPTAISAALTGLPPSTTVHYRLVVVGPHGTAFGADRTFAAGPRPGGPGTDKTAPAFVSASLSPTRFRVDPRARAAVPAAAAKKGTTLRFRLTEAARVVTAVERAQPGRRVGGTCVKPRKANRGRRSCTRWQRVGAFRLEGAVGANRRRFSGRIGKVSLRRGRHRMVLVATDTAGNASKPRTLAFSVVKR